MKDAVYDLKFETMKVEKYTSPETYTTDIISEGILCWSGFAPDGDNSDLYHIDH